MSHDPFAADFGRLEAAYARWLADRGVADPGAGASELVLMARGHGLRPIPDQRQPEPEPPASGLPAEYLQRKAALTANRTDPEGPAE